MKKISTKQSHRKIRVCHIITKMVYGGASLGTLHLVQSLDAKRFQCSIICGMQSDNEGSLLNSIEDRKVDIIMLPEIVREINPAKDFTALIKLVRIIHMNRYDIIHTHGSKAGFIGRLAAAISGVPIVLFTVHGWGLKAGSFFVCRIFRMIERILAMFTTKILFQTRADIAEARLYRIGKRSQYILIGNGINLQPFVNFDKDIAKQLKKKLNLGNKRIVGTVGRVSAQKNPVGFLTVAQESLREKSDVIFLFVGGGEMLEEMRMLVKELNLEKNIIFTGVRYDIPEVMANFDVFILPSLWEGMPRSVIEALALSKPVVAYRVGGLEEIIKDGENGLIISLNQTDKFVEGVRFLLENPAICKKMGRIGKTMVERYDFSHVVEKTEALYLRLFSRVNPKSLFENLH